MILNLTPEQRRRLIETVARRVAERLEFDASGAGGGSVAAPWSAAPADAVGSSAGWVAPCAIPPPGSPRYGYIMGELDARERERERAAGRGGSPSAAPTSPSGEWEFPAPNAGASGAPPELAAAAPPRSLSDSVSPSAAGTPGESLARLKDGGACRIGRPEDFAPASCADLAPLIDHTLLRPGATPREIEELCREALRHGFASVCVNGAHVRLCAGLLKNSCVKVCAVVGFPLGAMSPEAKACEARLAVAAGADELDMVLNIGRLKAGDFAGALQDVQAVVAAATGRPVKVILETGLLTDAEKVAACVIAKSAGARFVKTSTGFGPGGATAEDVELMGRVVGGGGPGALGIKASGGVRDCASALRLVHAGATRLGASASVAIVAEIQKPAREGTP